MEGQKHRVDLERGAPLSVLQLHDVRLQNIKWFYSSRCDLAFHWHCRICCSCASQNLSSLGVHPKSPC